MGQYRNRIKLWIVTGTQPRYTNGGRDGWEERRLLSPISYHWPALSVGTFEQPTRGTDIDSCPTSSGPGPQGGGNFLAVGRVMDIPVSQFSVGDWSVISDCSQLLQIRWCTSTAPTHASTAGRSMPLTPFLLQFQFFMNGNEMRVKSRLVTGRENPTPELADEFLFSAGYTSLPVTPPLLLAVGYIKSEPVQCRLVGRGIRDPEVTWGSVDELSITNSMKTKWLP